VITGGVPVLPVEIGRALAGRKLVDECAFGVSGQILDHLGYCVTVVAGEASELCPCLNADEKLNALLRAVDAEMTLAIALLLLGRGQSHDRLRGYSVTDYTVTDDEASVPQDAAAVHSLAEGRPSLADRTGPATVTELPSSEGASRRATIKIQCRLTPRDNELVMM
jgi:hypothetical protein